MTLPLPTDQLAITDLLARYNLALDLDDVEAWVALFTPDARYEVAGRVFVGRDMLRQLMIASPSAGIHLGGAPATEMLDADRARTRRNLLFLAADGTLRGALYSDELVRTPEGWRIARCRCEFDASREAPHPAR